MSIDYLPMYKPCPNCGDELGMGLSTVPGEGTLPRGISVIHQPCGFRGPIIEFQKKPCGCKEDDIAAVEAWNNLDRQNAPMTNTEIEAIALEVYTKDRFTDADQVWCNAHWLTKFARAVQSHLRAKGA